MEAPFGFGNCEYQLAKSSVNSCFAFGLLFLTCSLHHDMQKFLSDYGHELKGKHTVLIWDVQHQMEHDFLKGIILSL